MNADSVMQRGKSAAGKLVDITRAEFKANPFPYYAQLREHQPVMRARMGRLEGWLLTR